MMQSTIAVFGHEFLTSGIFLASILVLRAVLIRMIRRNAEILNKDQRRWLNRIKNTALVLALIGLIMIWAPQLQTFALSLTAFAVALVVATKEMILCVIGSLFRVSTQPYKVGDWVTIDGINGEVMDINALTTRLEEIDLVKSYNFTGRSVSIPNSKLFTAQINSQNTLKHFAFLDISTVVQFNELDPTVLNALYHETVQAHVQDYRADAKKFMGRITRKAGIDMPDPDATFGFRTTDLGHYVFSARICVPTARAAEIPALIATDFLSKVHKIRPVKPTVKFQE